MVRLCPGGIEPSAQANAVVQAPLFETKVRPVGAGSWTETFSAWFGPLLVTVKVYTAFVPNVAVAGPVFVIARSATVGAGGLGGSVGLGGSTTGTRVTLADALLFAVFESAVMVDTLAVLTIGFGPAYP